MCEHLCCQAKCIIVFEAENISQQSECLPQEVARTPPPDSLLPQPQVSITKHLRDKYAHQSSEAPISLWGVKNNYQFTKFRRFILQQRVVVVYPHYHAWNADNTRASTTACINNKPCSLTNKKATTNFPTTTVSALAPALPCCLFQGLLLLWLKVEKFHLGSVKFQGLIFGLWDLKRQ